MMEKITAIPTLISSRLQQICSELGVPLESQPFRDYYQSCGDSHKQIAIYLPCCDKIAAERLFSLRRYLSKKIIQLYCGKWVFICAGTIAYPGWEIDNMVGVEQCDVESDGDLLKRVSDSDLSCGIVDIHTNRLIWGSKAIRQTAGRSVAEMLLEPIEYIDLNGNRRSVAYGDQNATWEGFEQTLSDMNRDLIQQGCLENRRYGASNWVQRGGLWYTTPAQFLAKRIEMATLQGRICRVTTGVEVIEVGGLGNPQNPCGSPVGCS